MVCDMCGAEEQSFKINVEEAELTVCKNCSKFGKVIGTIKQQIEEKRHVEKYEPAESKFMDIMVEDYSKKIQTKRESLSLTQKEFAKKIREKESVIHQIESGHSEPSISLAKKIQKYLKIRIIEEFEEKHDHAKRSKAEAFTIGDFIKVKRK